MRAFLCIWFYVGFVYLFATEETTIKIDWIAALLVTLLIITLLAFFFGYFPYPFGWIVIALVLFARLSANSAKNDD